MKNLILNLVVLVSIVQSRPLDDIGSGGRGKHRCTAFDDCWPSTDEFAAFNASIDGNLVSSYPSLWQCHEPNFDQEVCQHVGEMFLNTTWRANQPGAYQNTLFEGNCMLPEMLGKEESCNRGQVPFLTAMVKTPDHVQKSVNFAREHGLRFRIKGLSHDFLGRSSGEGAFAISTINLKGVQVVENFIPEGCSEGYDEPVLNVKAGEYFADVYQAANQSERVIVGGAGFTVGASGGYIMGGGHSFLSSKFGLAVDNTVEFEVITADGNIVKANECTNQDLYWALRGGGSGFGVLLSTTYKTYPTFPHAVGVLMMNISDIETYKKTVETYLSMQLKLVDEGFAAYTYLSNTSMPGPYMFMTSFMVPDPKRDISSYNQTLDPLYDLGREYGIQTSMQWNIYPSVADFYGRHSESPVPEGGFPTILGSRLVSRQFFSDKDNISQLTEFLIEPGYAPVLHLVGGGKVHDFLENSTSVTPAWRKAIQHIAVAGSFAENNFVDLGNLDILRRSQVHDNVRQDIVERAQMLGDITGSEGSYINEDSPDAPNRHELWWGSNLERLVSIKRKYDPKGVFNSQASLLEEEGY